MFYLENGATITGITEFDILRNPPSYVILFTGLREVKTGHNISYLRSVAIYVTDHR